MKSQKRCNRQVTSALESSRKGYRLWTNQEERYLRQHRTDGAELIAHALGRSVPSVKAKANVLHVSLTYRPGDICPICGEHAIHPGTVAARYGMCIVCWERRKADQMREAASEERERNRYDAEKHRLFRVRRKKRA